MQLLTNDIEKTIAWLLENEDFRKILRLENLRFLDLKNIYTENICLNLYKLDEYFNFIREFGSFPYDLSFIKDYNKINLFGIEYKHFHFNHVNNYVIIYCQLDNTQEILWSLHDG
jgi:hypothetical protein